MQHLKNISEVFHLEIENYCKRYEISTEAYLISDFKLSKSYNKQNHVKDLSNKENIQDQIEDTIIKELKEEEEEEEEEGVEKEKIEESKEGKKTEITIEKKEEDKEDINKINKEKIEENKKGKKTVITTEKKEEDKEDITKINKEKITEINKLKKEKHKGKIMNIITAKIKQDTIIGV